MVFGGISVFAAVAFYVTTTFAAVPLILKRGLQPAAFPQILLVLLVVFAALMVLEARKRPWPKASPLPRAFFLTLAGGGLFVVLVVYIDFFVGLAAFAFITAWV